MKDLIPPSLRVILQPAFFLLLLVVLSVVLIRVGLARLSVQGSRLGELRKNENILREKESLLLDLQDELLPQADLSLAAMPDGNPTLVTLSQLKNLSLQRGIILTNLKAGAPVASEKDIQRIEISFEAEGELFSLLDFVASLGQIAPLTSLQKVEVTSVGGAARITVGIRSYWAAFPEKIPSLETPLSQFSADEEALLANFTALTPPPFGEITPTSPTTRADPFSF